MFFVRHQKWLEIAGNCCCFSNCSTGNSEGWLCKLAVTQLHSSFEITLFHLLCSLIDVFLQREPWEEEEKNLSDLLECLVEAYKKQKRVIHSINQGFSHIVCIWIAIIFARQDYIIQFFKPFHKCLEELWQHHDSAHFRKCNCKDPKG